MELHTVLRLTFWVALVLAGLSFFGLLPSASLPILGAVLCLLLPPVIGFELLSLRITKEDAPNQSLSTLSLLVASYAIGGLFVVEFVYSIVAFGVRDIRIIALPLVVISVLGLLFGLRPLSRSSSRDMRLRRTHLRQAAIVVAIVAIGISSITLFKVYQPFPTYETSEFQHFGKALQLIDGSSDFRVAERGYYLIPQVMLGLGSYLVGSHPLEVLWVSTFFQSTALAFGIFALSSLLFKRLLPAFVGSFVGMWLLGGTPVQNNPYVFSNGTVQYVFFVFAFCAVTDNLKANRRVRPLPLVLIGVIPALIFFQRVVIGYDSVLATLALPAVSLILVFRSRSDLLNGGPAQFESLLLLIVTFLAMLHPYVAPIYIFLIIVYVGFWKVSARHHGSIRFLPLGAILGSTILYVSQATGVVSFSSNFTLSHFVFGNLYQGVSLADVSFWDKYRYMLNGNTNLTIVFFGLSIGFLALRAWQGNRIALLVITMTAVSFGIYFFPEGLFVRARYLIPFFALSIAGGVEVLQSSLEQILGERTLST